MNDTRRLAAAGPAALFLCTSMMLRMINKQLLALDDLKVISKDALAAVQGKLTVDKQFSRDVRKLIAAFALGLEQPVEGKQSDQH